ncbi:MAG: prepilin-type N-terminal cleavage/methylation domain-containing protein [Pleurocapsa sp. SU_5_0]|nr:prepilin-type N-terminal cleavage/methylation domain-containing protein [Pleurocapsa sp. SU_5_0]
MKLIQKQILLKKCQNEGFTLIELLVVIIIVGILAAIAFPNFINQIGKARETDAKIMLGTIMRAQHAHHFEKKTFANNINALGIGNIGANQYYTYPNPAIATNDLVKHQAISILPESNKIRNFSIGIYHQSGLFDSVLCQSKDINEPVEAPNTVLGICTNDGIKLK